MKDLLSLDSVPSLISSLAVILALNLIFAVGKFVFELVKKKSDDSDKSLARLTALRESDSVSLAKMDTKLAEIEKDLHEIREIKKHLRRIFTAVKLLSGEKWADIRKVIMEDDLES